MGFVLGVLIAQGLLGKSAMSLDLKGAIVTIPQFTFLLPVQPPKASCPPWEFCMVTSSHLCTAHCWLIAGQWLTFLTGLVITLLDYSSSHCDLCCHKTRGCQEVG